mmetsp:Transcript_45879/g.91514  ORF Transcript_45879/g.91514 Transcript_45879/m.91514 type:complete len:230 (-) Transcript_45879:277-966(-)
MPPWPRRRSASPLTSAYPPPSAFGRRGGMRRQRPSPSWCAAPPPWNASSAAGLSSKSAAWTQTRAVRPHSPPSPLALLCAAALPLHCSGRQHGTQRLRMPRRCTARLWTSNPPRKMPPHEQRSNRRRRRGRPRWRWSTRLISHRCPSSTLTRTSSSCVCSSRSNLRPPRPRAWPRWKPLALPISMVAPCARLPTSLLQGPQRLRRGPRRSVRRRCRHRQSRRLSARRRR